MTLDETVGIIVNINNETESTFKKRQESWD